MNSKRKVLITGGLGFIFSHVTEYFVKKGYDVVVIDKQCLGYVAKLHAASMQKAG